MPSPFPGMDPYLEKCGLFPDFHAKFLNYLQEALADRLPENYEARVGERVNLLEYTEERTRRIGPDVAVEWRPGAVLHASDAAGVATIEPVTIPHLIVEETRETYIEILHRPDRTLVGVVELLSPSNKEEPVRTLYLAKRTELLVQRVHLLELDLLLGGRRLPLRDPLPRGDYYALLSRSDRRFDCEVYAWTVEQALPKLPVPLKAPDRDVQIDLGPIFTMTYERGRYARSIKYDQTQ